MASDLVLPAARVDGPVLRAALDAIISIDSQGAVLEFNPAAERMFGYAREDVIGADMAELIVPPAHREAHRNGLRRLLDGGADRLLEQRIELDAQHSDGSQFPVELAITRMAGAGATAIYTGFVRDLTDARLAERERHERIARQALVVALGQTALSGLAPPDLVAHALATLVEGLAVERGVALEVEPDGGLRREARSASARSPATASPPARRSPGCCRARSTRTARCSCAASSSWTSPRAACCSSRACGRSSA